VGNQIVNNNLKLSTQLEHPEQKPRFFFSNGDNSNQNVVTEAHLRPPRNASTPPPPALTTPFDSYFPLPKGPINTPSRPTGTADYGVVSNNQLKNTALVEPLPGFQAKFVPCVVLLRPKLEYNQQQKEGSNEYRSPAYIRPEDTHAKPSTFTPSETRTVQQSPRTAGTASAVGLMNLVGAPLSGRDSGRSLGTDNRYKREVDERIRGVFFPGASSSSSPPMSTPSLSVTGVRPSPLQSDAFPQRSAFNSTADNRNTRVENHVGHAVLSEHAPVQPAPCTPIPTHTPSSQDYVTVTDGQVTWDMLVKDCEYITLPEDELLRILVECNYKVRVAVDVVVSFTAVGN